MSHQRMVYVVDQDQETRRALTANLAAIGAEAWPFASGGEFIEILPHLMPACILLDMDLPHGQALEVMAELRRRRLGWPVLATSARSDLACAVDTMKRGAVDFLQKPVGEAALAVALAPAWEALERAVEEDEARRSAQERIARLTPREVDIALALLRGLPNKSVAYQLGISVRTVEMHRAHIMAKLGVRSLAEAALLATHAGVGLMPPASSSVAPRPAPRLVPPPSYLARRHA